MFSFLAERKGSAAGGLVWVWEGGYERPRFLVTGFSLLLLKGDSLCESSLIDMEA